MIPICIPFLGKNERKYILSCLRDNWISSSGKYIAAFEEAFSHYCGKKYGITTTNGTTALHLGSVALGLHPGDEVIMPSFTIASTTFATLYCGGKPVFVDSTRDTWNIDVNKIEEKITKKTKIIMPVHIYGHPCDMDQIMKIARKYHVYVVEDAAEAHGAEYKEKKVGGIGDVGCFSFYGNKIITCGEGGMIVTNNRAVASKCRSLRNLAFLEKKRFWHKELGFNYRMTNMQAALGLAQFEKIEALIQRRRENAGIYHSLLSRIPGLTLPIEKEGVRNVYWMYGLLVEKDFGISRGQLIKRLQTKGVETRPFFLPMHEQPILKKMGLLDGERYPVAEEISQKGLYLPSSSGLKISEIEYVCEAIAKARVRR